ncbi:MAG: phosphatidate cytidylyltransferase [Burkholderiales bacterium]
MMPTFSPLVALFAGVLAVLVFASAVGLLLKWRVADGAPHAVIDNLIARVNAWWVMVVVLGAAFAFGKSGVLALFAWISFLALREFVSLVTTRPSDHLALATAFFVVLPLQYWLVAIGWYGLYSVMIPVYAFLLLPVFAAFGKDTRRFLERVAKVQVAVMTTVYCVSYVPALTTLEIAGPTDGGLALIAWLVVVVQSSDVLQYVWGKLFGRTKVAPELSPSKTLEGLVGGVGCATALGAALAGLTPFTPGQAAGVALLVSVAGFLGGLVMSAIKRDRGVKDWGTLIEGHGGMLDRMDSIVFAAPLYFHLLRYGWT